MYICFYVWLVQDFYSAQDFLQIYEKTLICIFVFMFG